jgi:hypothetical protein
LNGHDRYTRRLIRELRGYAPDAERSVLIDAAEAAYARHHTVLAYQVGPRLIRGDLHLSNVIVVDNHVTGIDWNMRAGMSQTSTWRTSSAGRCTRPMPRRWRSNAASRRQTTSR